MENKGGIFMTEQEVKQTIDNLKDFKNTTVNFNENKKICDVYTRCTLPQEDFLAKVKSIKKIEVVQCDFGIFELIIPIKDLEKTLDSFVKTFSTEE
jgi:hypothetical protein